MHTVAFCKTTVLMAALLVALTLSAGAEEPQQDAGGMKYSQEREVAGVRPQKPVQIKFKRAESGKFGWELSGDNVEAVIEADRKLREYTKGK